MKEWGFAYKTIITWIKDRMGLGQYFRGITEHCLFGVKGNLPYKTINGKRQQGTTRIVANVGEHSRKPELMREMIEKVSYQPYIELFARNDGLFKPENWDAWGNEA
jgi:N6-adenosine-specific RNA methylase IME4